MGASVSTGVVDVKTEDITKIVVDCIVNVSQVCGASTNTSQTIELGDVTDSTISGLRQKSRNRVDLSCVQSSENDVKLQEDIETALKSHVDNQVKAQIPFMSANVANSFTKKVDRSITNFSKSIKIDDIKNCLASQVSEQKIKIGDVKNSTIEELVQDISLEMVVNCIQDSKNIVDAVAKLKKELASSASSNTSSGFSLEVLIIAAAIVLFFFLILMILLNSNSSKSDRVIVTN